MNGEKTSVLKETELFRDLDEDVLGVLAGYAIEKRLDRNEILFLVGEEATGLFVIAEGSVRAFRTGQDGREQIIHVEKAVTTIAEVPVFDNGRYPSTVAAEEPALVYFIAKREVYDLCRKYPQIALAAAGLLAGRLRKCARLVEELSLREVGQRLARLLLTQGAAGAERTADGGIRFRQKLTHNQLAARIGTVREVVTRSLHLLQEQKLIVIEGKDVTIPDPAVLAGYADVE